MKQKQLDMFEATGDKRAEQVSLFRYVRPLELYKNSELTVSAKGGIVFFFHINQILKKLTFTWSVCHEDDNFNRKMGMQIAKGRFDKFNESNIITDQILTIDYDRSLSLVNNVLYHLNAERVKMEKDGLKVKEIWSKQLYTLFSTLNGIIFINDELQFLFGDFEYDE